MTITYEDLAQTLIPNTTMQKMLTDGVHKAYRIKPISGYVLHRSILDIDVYDESYTHIIGIKFGYSPSGVYVTCGANYDFAAHTVIDENGDTFTACGDEAFFARPESTVPADQIFGGGNNHETI